MNILKQKKNDILIIILILLLSIVFFASIIMKRNSFHIPWDAFNQQYSWMNFIGQEYSNYRLPLWSNNFFSGFPTFADPQVGTFYPVNIFLSIFCNDVTNTISYFYIEMSIVFHFALIGIFTYYLCRQLKLSIIPSLLGAIIFEFCGYLTSHPEHYSTIIGVSWLPFCLIFLFKIYEKFKFKYLVMFSLGFTLSIFAGHVQTTIYTGMLVLFITIFLSYKKFREEGLKTSTRFFSLICIGFIISIVLGAIQIIPTFELMKNSIRSNMTFDEFSSSNNSPIYLISTFIPYFFGTGFSFNNKEPAETYLYIGITAILLISIALSFASKLNFTKNNLKEINNNRFNIKMFSLFSIIFLILSFGAETIVQKIMYAIPFINKLQRSVNYLFIVFILISIIAAYGAEILINKSKYINISKLSKTFKRINIILIFSVILLSFGLLFSYNTIYYQYIINMTNGLWITIIMLNSLFYITLQYLKEQISKKCFLILFLIITLLDLFTFNSNTICNSNEGNYNKMLSHNYLLNDSNIPSIIKNENYDNRSIIAGMSVLNIGGVLKFSDVWGYNPLVIDKYSNFLSRANLDKGPFVKENTDLSHNFFNLLSVKYIVTTKYFATQNKTIDKNKYVKIYDNDDKEIYENTNVIPMYNLTSKLVNVKDENQILDLIEKDNYNPLNEVYSNVLKDKQYIKDKNDTIKLIEKKGNTVKLKVENKNESYLIASDIIYPGWKVKVNGKETNLDTVNYLFRGVELDPGENLVEMYYMPDSIIIGLILSSSGVIILFFTHLILLKKRKDK